MGYIGVIAVKVQQEAATSCKGITLEAFADQRISKVSFHSPIYM